MTRSRGFTLPEVLATMVLMGIVLPVAMAGITHAMQTSARARHDAEASELAHSKLAELAVLKDSSQFASSGTFGSNWPEYRWESTSETGSAGTTVVSVTVFWTERSLERSKVLSTMVYVTGSTAESATEAAT